MDKENLINVFKLANSSLSTLSYQINSLNYNPTLHQFDQLQHFFSFFKQRINNFEADFNKKTQKISQKSLNLPLKINEPNQYQKPNIPRLKSAAMVSQNIVPSLSSIQHKIKENLKEKPQTYQEKSVRKSNIKRPVSGFTKRGVIIPEEIRNNPFADLPILTEKDVKRGFFSLVNQGLVPKNADLTPGLAKPPVYRLKSARIHSKISKNESKNQKGCNFFLTEKIVERGKQERRWTFLRKQEENYNICKEIIKIQRLWRRYSKKKWLKRVVLSVRRLQKIGRKVISQKKIKDLLMKREVEVVEKYKDIQRKLKETWKLEKHVEIVVNCSNDRNENLLRIFEIARDEKIEIIYVSCNEIPNEIKGYYSKILELYEVKNFDQRIHFINIKKIRTNHSNLLSLYYSSKALQKIKSLLKKGVCGYISSTSCEDILYKLASFLNVGLFNGDVHALEQIHVDPGSINTLFANCGFPFTPRSELMKDLENLMISFGKLIINNPNIEKWAFKKHSPGHKNDKILGYFDLHEFRQLRGILNSNALSSEQKANSLLTFLSENFPDKIKFLTRSMSPKEFIQQFLTEDCFIEGVPPTQTFSSHVTLSLVFQISPIGEKNILATYETSYLDQMPVCVVFPQTILTNLNLEAIAEKITKEIFKGGIFGIVTLDLLVFEGKNIGENLFWTHSIQIGLTEFMSIFSFFNCLMRDGEFDPLNKCFLLNKDQTIAEDFWKKRPERCFSFISNIKFDGIREIDIRKFFEFCKNSGICFDFERREGDVFMLEDALNKGSFGILCVDEKKEGIGKKIMGVLQSVRKKFQKGTEKKKEYGELEYFVEKLRRAPK